jgi:transcriptional regulator with XRE-family HTH domain
MTWNKKLKNWRKSRNITAEQAGELIGVSKAQWIRMENGDRGAAPNRVLLLESLTGITRYEICPDVFGVAEGQIPEIPRQGAAAEALT